MKIIILIPSYNDNRFIPELITRIMSVTKNNILIIDDGSKIPIDYNENNVTIIRNNKNIGKGASILKGLKFASKKGYTHAITIDSDLQHSPEKLPEFINTDCSYDLVSGYRVFNSKMPFHRVLSNKITSWIISKLCGIKILDSQCGYRRYNIIKVLSSKYKENGFQFESEILLELANNNLKISHIEIPTIYSDEVSSINNVSDTIKFIKLILKNIWNRL